MAISKSRRKAVFQRDAFCCRFYRAEGICGRDQGLTLHHIEPLRHNGGHHPSNLVTLCDLHHHVIERDAREREYQHSRWDAEGLLLLPISEPELPQQAKKEKKPRKRRSLRPLFIVQPELPVGAPPGHYFDMYMRSQEVRDRARENFQAAWEATNRA